MTSYPAALAMLATITATATEHEHELLATLDPIEAAAELGSGRTVVLVNPPATTWETWAVQVHAFEVTVISPDRDPLTAWPILDSLADDLATPLAIDTARLTFWQPQTGDPWPCVHLTLDTTTQE